MYNYSIKMNNYTKAKRLEALAGLLRGKPLATQAEVLRALVQKGFRTTQATVSRDLRELGFVKAAAGPHSSRYEPRPQGSDAKQDERLRVAFKTFVTGIRGTAMLILVKTTPGNAAGVAGLVDRIERPEILGTVAGDDTILVIVDREEHRKRVEDVFRTLRGG
jgi:transcriptional regulator of arginine metabolism